MFVRATTKPLRLTNYLMHKFSFFQFSFLLLISTYEIADLLYDA